ncbi:MAG: DUF6236 family protein [Alkalimonas sp.]|nr:DUF6236 family protein [Alkalimonas sp.]
MNKDALYYPHIALKNPGWIKAMALLYDNIYRIVPDNVIPEDSVELQALLEEGSVGKMIDPAPYSKNAADEFMGKLDEWDAAAFDGDPDGEDTLTRIHEDKTDQRVKALFREAGFQSENEWMYVPTEIASHYMLYLANDISKKNALPLITGDWGAWTGTSYFNVNGQLDESITPDMESEHLDDPFGIFSLIVSEITPINISEVPAEDILKFRLSRADEIANFRNCIGELHDALHSVDSNEIKLDIIEAKVKELERAKKDYQDSADLIKAKGWFGVSMMGFPAPVVFGKLMSIPTASTVALGAAGLALGAMYSTRATSHELKKLRRDNQVSMLVDMNRSFRNYTSARGGGDINYHAWNCMEEFVND